MKHDREDAEAQAAIHEMKAEIRTESRSERRDELVREFIEHAYERSSATPEQMQYLVEATLIEQSAQYPSLLDIHGGDAAWAASKVVEHMIDAARHGVTLTLTLAIMELEQMAADIIHSPSKLWLPEG
jgi:hypothetical protein